MKLIELLRELDYTLVSGDMGVEITGVIYDSRKVEEGSLFVCLTGFRADGHDYIPDALAQGARALVVERELRELPPGVTVIQVDDSRRALALLSAAWFGWPARKMTTIALTGTKGKTTTAHMLRDILAAAGHRVGMIGTLGAFIGGERIPTKNTTPESYELHSLFARMVEAGCTHLVMEASSQGFKLHRTDGIQFDFGAFLNLSPDHIGPGEHADFGEYLHCKSLLFRQCRVGVANMDDPHWVSVTDMAVCPVRTFSLEGPADLRVTGVEELREPGFLGSRLTLTGLVNGQVRLGMPGRFNAANAAAAMSVAALLGVDRETMDAALSRVRVKGRTQVLPTPGHYTVLIDYAHNAVSMEELLSMLRSYRPHRLICLFGGGGDRSKLRRYAMGEMSAKYADLTVLTMDNPRSEPVEAINEDIKVGLARHDGQYVAIPDRAEAIRWALDHAEEGDIIALIGKGHEEYQEIQGVKHPFSEEQVVREHLRL